MRTIALSLGLLLAGAAFAQPDIKEPLPIDQVLNGKLDRSSSPSAPPGMQYLYGSGEAAAMTRATWRSLVEFVRANAAKRRSVILDPDTTLTLGKTIPCQKGQPLAAVFDVDETVLLNLGAEYDGAMGTPYTNRRWQQWEVLGGSKVMATPGAVEALRDLRGMGLTVIFNTNRVKEDHVQNARTISDAGLGPALYLKDGSPNGRDQTLYLADGWTPAQKAKDKRRQTIASHFCVIVMGGDQLGDFSDMFNPPVDRDPPPPPKPPLDRRRLTDEPGVTALLGRGWFLFPNPVYGSGMQGTIDEVFDPDMRWPSNESGGR